jgi:FKBP-type peptidyl-prolyl cis-trans isomerase
MRKLTYNESVGVAVAIAVIGFLLFGGQFLSLFKSNPVASGDNVPAFGAEQKTTMDIPTTGVKTEDLVVGTGAEAKAGDKVTVNYVGMLTDGKVFDSSYDRGQPFELMLGAGQVIKGWDEGLQGMKVGGKRRLVIAPDYAYGNQNVGPIPANSPLVFEVELLDVTR